MAAGAQDPTPVLKQIGQAGADKIRYVIEGGLFPNNIVSDAWADVKGFKEAMFHYGDLKSSATYKISTGKGTK